MNDKGFTIAVDDVTAHTGVLVTGNKQTLVDHLKNQFGVPLPMVELVIQMSCGHQVTYKTKDDIPDTDVPCPCGDPTHWFIRYQDEK